MTTFDQNVNISTGKFIIFARSSTMWFSVFQKMDISLKGSHFVSTENVNGNVASVLKGLPENYFHPYFQALKTFGYM